MRSKWCGVTSAVTFIPRALANLSRSTPPAVVKWQMCRRLPTCSAKRISRAIIASSATAGQPVKPSFEETTPSFICEPTVSAGSCACCAIIPLNVFTYSSARRIKSGSETHLPSSLKIRTRAFEFAIAPSSASASPFSP